MATKKAASTKKATAKKSAASKTTVRTVSTKKVDAKKEVVAKASATKRGVKLPENIINIIFAELVGTFVLTLVALTSFSDGSLGAIAIGLTLMVLVMGVGAVSGAHVNPAVTFGLWTMRRLKTILLPFYWCAQFIGAMLAVIVTNWISNGSVSFALNGFTSMNWSVFGIELVGTAVFLFGIAAATSRNLGATATAAGVGLALVVGILSANYLTTSAKTQAIAEYQKSASQASEEKTEIPHIVYVKGASLNPAVALAMTDSTESELTTGSASEGEVANSRFSLESIFGTLVGAALGGNLYLLIAGRKKND